MTLQSGSTRRRFVGSALAGGAFLALGPRLARAAALGANERIRVGVIGTGGRARGLMRQLKEIPGCELVAVSDVYEPRVLEAAEIAGPRAAKHPDYRRLLDDKEIDAVLIGSPDHWHLKMTADALAAGKDVYLEKPVSHSLEEGDALVKLVEGSKQVVQTGTQQRSWEHFMHAKELIAVALSVAARCDPCVGFHTQALVRLGATRAELAETLAMAVYMGGGPSLMYAADALSAWEQFSAPLEHAAAAA